MTNTEIFQAPWELFGATNAGQFGISDDGCAWRTVCSAFHFRQLERTAWRFDELEQKVTFSRARFRLLVPTVHPFRRGERRADELVGAQHAAAQEFDVSRGDAEDALNGNDS